MEKILYRIYLKNGKSSEKLYESTKDWMAEFKINEVLKIEDGVELAVEKIEKGNGKQVLKSLIS